MGLSGFSAITIILESWHKSGMACSKELKTQEIDYKFAYIGNLLAELCMVKVSYQDC